MNARLGKLQKFIAEQELDAIIITSPANIFYLYRH